MLPLLLLTACAAPDPPTPPVVAPPACPTRPTDGFDFPVGAPDARGYRDAQPFGVNRHLGHDWNGVGGGNTDYGDPVYVVADGVVTEVRDVGRGWGLVVRVAHRARTGCVESLYAHLASHTVQLGQTLTRGQTIGTIGDADGAYLAHLHFELRDRVGAPLGAGYGPAVWNVDATAFIRANRP